MADINPNIAMGYQPIQVENPVNQFAKMQELKLGQAKMQEYERGLQEQNALRDLIKSGVDLKSPEARMKMYSISPELGIKFEKSQAELEKAGYEAKKLKGDVAEQDLKMHRERVADLAFNPSNENILAHLQDAVLRGNITQAQAKQQWAQVGGMPLDQRKQYFTQMGVNAEKRLTDITTRRGQDLTAQVTREGHALQYNPELQGKISEEREKGKARAEDMSQQMKDVQANRKALASAGYDVTTGKDEITDLIKKSTGSGVGKGVDILGAAVGKSTKGSEALAALETRANAITSGLLNGKLGAGISNADRDFIVAQIGNLASGTTPTATRLAAWNAAKERMIKLGMIEAPSTPDSNINVPGVGTTIKTPGSSATTAPAGKPTLDSIFGTGKKD